MADLLFDSFEAHRVLVIAPLRVARDTWPTEVEKWDHLHGLIISTAVGTEEERLQALKAKADLYVINRENMQWLVEKSGMPFDYDTVVIDELSSFKNGQAKRFKSLLSVRPKVKRIIGLTGTPVSNGLMDLWAEFRVLDMGQRLGRFITHYRNEYFTPDKRNGMVVFSYKPLPGAEERIYEKISDMTISMKATDHLQKYVGDMRLQKTFITDHISKRQVKNEGQLPQYYVRDAHEAIIDRDTFERVQAELQRRAELHTPSKPHQDDYLFTGKIVCGQCGKHYRRKITVHKVVWICATFNRLGKAHCASQQIPEQVLLELVDGEPFTQLRIPAANIVVIVRPDGTEVTKHWQTSRRDSWTEEMRMEASKKAKERNAAWQKEK